MIKKYRKKPVVIEALIWTGVNVNEMYTFTGHSNSKKQEQRLRIKTLEGHIWAEPGDYIIKGVQGEFYPCKPDIFKMTYEECDE